MSRDDPTAGPRGRGGAGEAVAGGVEAFGGCSEGPLGVWGALVGPGAPEGAAVLRELLFVLRALLS